MFDPKKITCTGLIVSVQKFILDSKKSLSVAAETFCISRHLCEEKDSVEFTGTPYWNPFLAEKMVSWDGFVGAGG